VLRDLHAAAWWAGLTAFVWYAFGTVPLHISVSEQLGLTTAQTSSWIFIVWFSSAVASIATSLYFRQPIPITWTIPGLVYLGTLAGRFSFAELVGANLVAGVLVGARHSAAWGLRKEDQALKAALDEYLRLKQQSASWSRLVVKYFGPDALAILDRAARP